MSLQQLIILLVYLILSACKHSTLDNKNETLDVYLKDGKIDTIANSNTTDNLKIAKQFAETFVPDTTIQSGFNKSFTFPDSVVTAFKFLRSDKPNQEKYLTLLYLKIYRGQLQCCHQSFELRRNLTKGIDSILDPLLFEFNNITKFYNSNERIEMIGSGIGVVWVEKNNYLLSYDKIAQEYDTIKLIETNIEKGSYWKK